MKKWLMLLMSFLIVCLTVCFFYYQKNIDNHKLSRKDKILKYTNDSLSLDLFRLNGFMLLFKPFTEYESFLGKKLDIVNFQPYADCRIDEEFPCEFTSFQGVILCINEDNSGSVSTIDFTDKKHHILTYKNLTFSSETTLDEMKTNFKDLVFYDISKGRKAGTFYKNGKNDTGDYIGFIFTNNKLALFESMRRCR